MPYAEEQPTWPAFASLAVAGLITFLGLSRFGIWDPWELTIAETARLALQGVREATSGPPLSSWLISGSFEVFGVSAWAGRLPFALSGLLLCVLVYFFVRPIEGRRTAWLSVIVTATCPLFLLNSRQMLGEAPGLLGQALVGYTAFRLATSQASGAQLRWVLGFGASIVVSTLASGMLLGPLPPILAVAVALVLTGGYRAPVLRHAGAWIILVTAIVCAALVTQAVIADAAVYSAWVGGTPLGDDPPTFDAAIERAFYGFAPWSALGILAFAHALLPSSTDEQQEDERPLLRVSLALWAVFAYASLTLFTSRYGGATYLAVAAVAPLIAIFLNDSLDRREARWPEITIALLFLGLLIRDYALYPSSPLTSLAAEDLAAPTVFDPKLAWAGLLGFFGLGLVLLMTGRPEKPAPEAAWRWMRAQWERHWVFKLWLSLAAGLMVAFVVFGLVCFFVPLPLPTITVRVGRALFFVPFAIVLVVVGAPQLVYYSSKLGHWSFVPLLVAGLAFGFYLTLGYQVALSQHFSPRKAYDRYEQLADVETEPIAMYRTEDGATHYYTSQEVRELKSTREVVDYLTAEGRRWLIFPSENLSEINRAYRKETRKHLFVVDARSARLVLASNEPLPNMRNQNVLSKYVISEAPEVQFPVGAVFGNKVELIGYDLKLPGKDFVGAGQRFKITWYWRALRPVGTYKVFVHIDGFGNRVNGDHEPVDGKYKTNQWQTEDVVVDEQRLRIPANYPVGDYSLLVGLFSGKNRLEVTKGSNDGENRVLAGKITVR